MSNFAHLILLAATRTLNTIELRYAAEYLCVAVLPPVALLIVSNRFAVCQALGRSFVTLNLLRIAEVRQLAAIGLQEIIAEDRAAM